MSTLAEEKSTLTEEKSKQELFIQTEAERLDRLAPGWAWNIDLNKLDLSSIFNCVLAQVFGDYTRGLHLVRDDGYIKKGAYSFDSGYRSYWVKEIQARTGR